MKEVLLFVVSLFVAILLGEAAIRTLDLAPKAIDVAEGRYRVSTNARLGYEPIPNLQYTGEDLYNYNWRGDTNRLGFRARDYPTIRKAGTQRIGVVGDSIAEGLWIETYAKTFPGVMESSLSERGIAAEVLNFGLVGYNTRQEVEAVRHFLLPFSPDVVVLQYCLNDRERNDGELLSRLLAKERESGGLSPVAFGGAMARSALWRYLRFKAFPVLLSKGPEIDPDRRFKALADDTVEESLRELGAMLKAQSLPGLVVIFPHLGSLAEYQFREEHEAIRRIAEDVGLRVLDLQPAFLECERQLGAQLSLDEYHPNEAGHHCAGKAIAAELTTILTGRK